MSQLSKQSIEKLCQPPSITFAYDPPWHPLISPFEPSKIKVNGVSKGLSHASYDASIAHDLVLGRHPGFVVKEWALEHFGVIEDARETYVFSNLRRFTRILKAVQAVYNMIAHFGDLAHRLRNEPPHTALAYTVEDFCFPDNVAGAVCDKSTMARCFVSAYNTFFDPGFHGNATLEIVNDSDKVVTYKAGQGVCQFIFTWLDEPTASPYDGKYQHQTKEAHGPRFEMDTVEHGKLPDHWHFKCYPWKYGFEFEIIRKDHFRSGGQARTETAALLDAIAMAYSIDARQPMA